MLLDLFPALLICACALAGGCALLRCWDAPTPSERLVLAWALGFALHGTATLLVGLWRFDRWTLAAIDLLLLLVGGGPLWRLGRELVPIARDEWARVKASWLGLALVFALIIFALLDIVGAATMPLDGDALRYHLAVPQHWLREGAIGLTLGIPYASFPLLAQLSYAHALAFGALAAPALLHTLWALMLSLGIFIAARRFSDTPTALLAALLFLSLTDVSAEAKLPRVDLVVGLYGWGVAWCWLRWRATRGNGWLICAGLCAGAAAASKYTGLILALVAGALILYDVARRSVRWTALLRFAACAALVAAPWYLKNVLLTGNPVFPFAGNLFGGPLPPDVLATLGSAENNYVSIARTPLNFVLTPLLLVFDHYQFASGRIGPLWLLLPLLALRRPRVPDARATLVWGLLFALLWFWTSPRVRFAFPVFALWSPLLASVLRTTIDQRRLTIDQRRGIHTGSRFSGSRLLVFGSWVTQCLVLGWLGFALASSAGRALPSVASAVGLRGPTATLAAAPRVDQLYSLADLQRASDVDGPLIVFETAGFYIDRSTILAGDLGSDPPAALDARYGGARCGSVAILLPDTPTLLVDQWVAARVRPWIERHAHTVVYRRGNVALYKVDGCTHH